MSISLTFTAQRDKSILMHQKSCSVLLILMLSGCSTAVPTAITYRGHSLTGSGSSTPDLQEFSFKVADDEVACSGHYSLPKAFANKFTFPISCSDGRTAKVEAERSMMPTDMPPPGSRLIGGTDYPVRGRVNFSDGSVGMFNLGGDARNMNTQSVIYQSFTEGINEPKFK